MFLRSETELGSVDDDAPLLVLFQPVDAADQRRLAGTRRAADDDTLAPIDGQVDVAQDVERAEPLVHVVDVDGDLVRKVGAIAPVERFGVSMAASVICGAPSDGRSRACARDT